MEVGAKEEKTSTGRKSCSDCQGRMESPPPLDDPASDDACERETVSRGKKGVVEERRRTHEHVEGDEGKHVDTRSHRRPSSYGLKVCEKEQRSALRSGEKLVWAPRENERDSQRGKK